MTQLTTLQAIDVTGDEATDFLQSLFTADMAAEPTLTAWCDPKGRVIGLFELDRLGDGWRLWTAEPMAEALARKLSMFKLRRAVEIRLGATRECPPLDAVREGIPHILPDTDGAFLALTLSLDLAGAVAPRKGCYPGQEIIARTRSLGAVKRRLARLRVEGAPPQRNARILSDGKHAGDVVLAATDGDAAELLAVVRVERMDEPLALEDGRGLERLELPFG